MFLVAIVTHDDDYCDPSPSRLEALDAFETREEAEAFVLRKLVKMRWETDDYGPAPTDPRDLQMVIEKCFSSCRSTEVGGLVTYEIVEKP